MSCLIFLDQFHLHFLSFSCIWHVEFGVIGSVGDVALVTSKTSTDVCRIVVFVVATVTVH